MSGEASRGIYLDNHATTRTDPRVAAAVCDCLLRTFGNASSADHGYGDEAGALVESAVEAVGKLVGTCGNRVVFTSGATESLNLAIQGFVRHRRAKDRARRILIGRMPVEHAAVLETCAALEGAGLATVLEFRVDRYGQLDLESFESRGRGGLDLACVMAANNEIGTVYPLRKASRIAKQHGVTFLTDATQAIGKIEVQFEEWGVDLLAFSAHKIYGPKGVGALVVSAGIDLEPLLFGGGHQRGMRPGTLNVPGIVGLGEACRLRLLEMADDEPAVGRRRNLMLALLSARIPDLIVNGHPTARLAGSLHISVPHAPNEAIVARLKGRVAISTGAACSSGAIGPSHVLRAIGMPASDMEGALRIGLGKFTTDDDVADASAAICDAVEAVRLAMTS